LDKVELDCFESDATRNTFRIHSDDQAILQPWMRADEVEAIRAVIRQRQPKRVLEFGAGGSTVTFAREPGIQEWWSCEHSPEWVNRVLSVSTDSNISIVTCPIDRILERIDQLLGLQFDMFFVDAFDRAAILKRLHAHLKSSPGFVLLHDASRKQYDDAIGCFPVRSTLTEGDGRHQGLVLLENTGD
jgi:predicted O-methyltransferase YrrM